MINTIDGYRWFFISIQVVNMRDFSVVIFRLDNSTTFRNSGTDISIEIFVILLYQITIVIVFHMTG